LELVVIWLALAGVVALIDECTRPPFEWQEDGLAGQSARAGDGATIDGVDQPVSRGTK
jgi:hypothetical protein